MSVDELDCGGGYERTLRCRKRRRLHQRFHALAILPRHHQSLAVLESEQSCSVQDPLFWVGSARAFQVGARGLPRPRRRFILN